MIKRQRVNGGENSNVDGSHISETTLEPSTRRPPKTIKVTKGIKDEVGDSKDVISSLLQRVRVVLVKSENFC